MARCFYGGPYIDMSRCYYEAYDGRYKAVHESGDSWFSDTPTTLLGEIIERYGVTNESSILELGCGEGRDAAVLLKKGFPVSASDVSAEAIAYCRSRFPEFADSFFVLDCVKGDINEKFDLIYAVAVLHMLVSDEDRMAFYSFIRSHLNDNGVGLIMTMGDGEREFSTDPTFAFELSEREHAGKKLMVPATSCRIVSFDTFEKEIGDSGLKLLEKGVTSIENEFDSIMYAVVKA